MTKAEYADYERRFAQGTRGFEIVSTSANWEEEPFFSWRPCEICRRNLGGDRYAMVMTNPGPSSESEEVNACVDCYYYAEYGQLDDMTMAEIG